MMETCGWCCVGSGDVNCEDPEGANSGVIFWVGFELGFDLELGASYLCFDDLIMDKGLHFK